MLLEVSKKGVVRLTAVCALLAVMFYGGYRGSRYVSLTTPPPTNAMPYVLGVNNEYVVIYIGSAGCVYCLDEELPAHVHQIVRRVREQAESEGVLFHTVGISIDPKAEEGIGHLARLGPFDEVLAGASWVNTGAMKYVWDGFPAEPATPQVLVVRRVVEMTQTYFRIESESVVRRELGLPQIERWASVETGL